MDSSSILVPKIEVVNNQKPAQVSKQEQIAFKNGKSKMKKLKKPFIIGFIAFFVSAFVLFLLLALVGFGVYKDGIKLKDSLLRLKSSVSVQDIELINKELNQTKTTLSEFKKSYKRVSFFSFLPFVGNYIKDGNHSLNALSLGLDAGSVLIETIEPYSDIIGFKNGSKNSLSGDETTQDRIDFIVKTIPEIVPKADVLIKAISDIDAEIAHIDPYRYPEEFKGIALRAKMIEAFDLFDTGAKFVINGKPLLEAVPYLIGLESERKYLVLFQNDKELRPTGGFITAYSIAKVNKAKFNPVLSDDIYNLDDKYIPRIIAPDPIVKYLKGPYTTSRKLKLRDMNWSPSFSESMNLFLEEAKSTGLTGIDGIIAVDTALLVNLLEAIGPVGVPGYGEFSNKIVPECNCPQVIYELESFADVEGPIVWSENEPGKIVYAPKNYDDRKGIIGHLMNSILANTLGQSKEKLPKLFEEVFKSVIEKHVLIYIPDSDIQKAVVDFGLGGTLTEYQGDYIHINDANLGGRKSNLYITSSVEESVDIKKDGSVEKTVVITYKNPEKYDGWLNSVLPNWIRVYVPKGSELIEFSGLEEKTLPYEDLGKTVFAGFYQLRPQGVVKLTLKYKLPFKAEDYYKLYIQKQPGKDKIEYTLTVGKKREEFLLTTDKEFKFSI